MLTYRVRGWIYVLYFVLEIRWRINNGTVKINGEFELYHAASSYCFKTNVIHPEKENPFFTVKGKESD